MWIVRPALNLKNNGRNSGLVTLQFKHIYFNTKFHHWRIITTNKQRNWNETVAL